MDIPAVFRYDDGVQVYLQLSSEVFTLKITTLEYFLTLAQSSSISEASQRLYIAQPTLTKALQQFEQEIGVKLFERSRDGISLTAAGKQILPQAQQMVGYYHEWLEMGQQAALQSIDIYISRSFSDLLLPNILVKFRQRHPELPVNYITVRTPGQFISRNLQKPSIALFLCSEKALQTYTKIQGNKPLILCHGESRCLVSKYSPLANKSAIPLSDLENLLLVLPGSSRHEETAYSSDSGFISHIFNSFPAPRTIHVETVTNVINQVAENPQTYAISYYPVLKRYERVRRGELVYPIFEDGHQYRENLCLFYSKAAYDQHPLMAELILSIRDAFREFFDALEK